MNKIMTADFHGTNVLAVELDGTVYVVLKPIVEGIGLAWNGQLERIKRNPVLREGMRMVRIPSVRGGDQETVTLRLDRLHGWLFSVDLGHVREAIRDRVELYQRECHDVLYRYFCGDRDKQIREANETTSLNLRLVTECRHIHGNRAADQLWIKVRLPRVPEMDEAFKQFSLFDYPAERRAA